VIDAAFGGKVGILLDAIPFNEGHFRLTTSPQATAFCPA
jgi:hypothetical protein